MRDLVLAACLLGLAGCTLTQTMPAQGPGSSTFTLNRPFTVPAAPGETAPADPLPPLGAPPAPAQGRYEGRIEVMFGGVERSCQPLNMTNFRVEGNTVRFGPFVGQIRHDGSVSMQAGRSFISGQFEGSHFQGRYWAPPPNCTYSLSFNPVGS